MKMIFAIGSRKRNQPYFYYEIIIFCFILLLPFIARIQTVDGKTLELGDKYWDYAIAVDDGGKFEQGVSGHAMNLGYTFSYDTVVSSTGSQRWPVFSKETKGEEGYTSYINFSMPAVNLNNRKEDVYFGFSIYADTDILSDLPSVVFGKYDNGWQWSDGYILSENISLNKWNDVRIKVTDMAGILELSAVTQIRFRFDRAVSRDYNIYIKGLGFYTLNIGEEEIFDDNSDYGVIWEKSPRVTIGDSPVYRDVRGSIFGKNSSEPYVFCAGDREEGSYITYKTKGVIADFQIDAFTTGEKRDPNAVHEIYLSVDGENYVKLEEGMGYRSKIMQVENNQTEWFNYYKMRRMTMQRDVNPYIYHYLKIVFPYVDTNMKGQARCASMLGDVHIWSIDEELPTVSIANSSENPADNTLKVRFSKRMNEETIKPENFRMERLNVISASYSDADKSALLVLDGSMDENSDYTLEISGNVKSIMNESILNRQVTFETATVLMSLLDDNSNPNILHDKAENVSASTFFGANSSEPYVYQTNGKGGMNYITYKAGGVITGFEIKTYSSSERKDPVKYPASDKYSIYLSEDGKSFDKITDGKEYEVKSGTMVENSEVDWFNYYCPHRYVSNADEFPKKYRYIKIQFPSTDVDYSAQIGDVKIHWTDVPVAIFDGFIGEKSIKLYFNNTMNAQTVRTENFKPSSGLNITNISLLEDKKTVVISFDKTITDSEVYYIDINKKVLSESGNHLSEETRRICFRKESVVAGEEKNHWSNVRFGGGGMITGIVCHPMEEDLVYIRTDVGGIYRYDKVCGEWIPLNDALTGNEKNLMGIAGIAVDPQNTDVVYAAAGTYWYWKEYGTDVLKSSDRGKTWKKTGLNAVFEANNGKGRRWGECIAVDPNNSDVIYCGTRFKGLAASDDGAETWYYIKEVKSGITVPDENAYQGVRVVTFDKESGVTDGRTSVVYAASDGIGVYKSENGGRTWRLIEGSPLSVFRMECIGGKLYMAAETGVFEYDGIDVSDITPDKLQGVAAETISTAYTMDGQPVIIVSGLGTYPQFYIYRKIGEGNWELCSDGINQTNIIMNEMTWMMNGGSFCATAIDPFPDVEGEILMWGLDGAGMWKSTNMLENDVRNIKYSFDVKGIEETCINNIVSVPGDAPYVGIMDYGGWKMSNSHSYDNYHFRTISSALTDHVNGEYLGQLTGFDFCEGNPNYIALSADYVDYGLAGTSEDGGKSWVNNGFPTTNGAGMGDVAVSSEIKDGRFPVLLACARRNEASQNVYVIYSENWGKTWHRCKGLPVNFYDASQYDQTRNVIEPDRVKGNVFYAIDAETGEIYISNDWGTTFVKSKAIVGGVEKGGYCSIVANPQKAGEVYIVANNSLFKSIDGCNTVKKLTEFSDVTDISYGKGKVTGKYMALYVFGNINGERGLYRSDDNGATWIKLNDARFGLSNAGHIEADRDVYGKIYVGTSGRGVLICQEPEYMYSITSGGEMVSGIPKGEFSISLTSYGGFSFSACLVAALYNDNGNMLVDTYLAKEKNRSDCLKFQVDIPDNVEFDMVKCFLWNINSLAPLIEVKEFRK